MKTTFKDIAHHYLGTGLRCQIGLVEARLCGVNDEDGAFDNCSEWPQIYKYIDLTKAIPLLRPLSSLTDREIEPGVIGLVDFLKPEINLTGQKIERIGNMFYARDAFGNAPVFHFHESTSLPFPKWQWLLRHHFNCFSLDESEFIAI